MADFEYLDNDGLPIAFAHRGGIAEAARTGLHENSLEAFRLAANLGYRYVETDVRATGDGELYTWHGQGLERINKWQALRKRDIETIRINGERAVPLLSEVLEEFPDIRFAIDPKHWPAVKPLAETILATKAFNRVSVGAFSQGRAEKVAKLIFEESGVEVCTGMGARGVAGLAMHAYVLREGAWRPPSPIANLPRTASTVAMVRAAHNLDVKAFTWVVNDEAEMTHFLNLGIDGIYTDEPSLLKRVMQERGLWSSH